ncbi:unnamed protein product [Sphagnum troendelagicum]|uniref:Nudix hydrolase domain-containing protein n=1 Tax=Sphagnum troendelagicum TaxID=128251 RepID=A0ABP0V482_9BRYO
MALQRSFVASSVAQQQQQQQRLLLAAPTHPVQSLAWKHRCPPAKRLLTASKALAPTFLMSAMLSGEQQTKRMEHSEAGALDGYLERVQACNKGQEKRREFLPFEVEGSMVGYVHHRLVERFIKFPYVFTLEKGDTQSDGVGEEKLILHRTLTLAALRTKAVEGVLRVLRKDGIMPGERSEVFSVVTSFGSRPLFDLDRAAVPYFGTKAYGVHMNGYVQIDGEKHLWVAKRSSDRQNFPGAFDHIVAGGQPAGLSCKENLIKESDEEASIPGWLAEKAVPVGAISYEQIEGERMKRDVLFCYDLELPPDFQPHNKDGEVESFELVPVHEVAELVRTSNAYKPNCNLVIINFLFRHGYIHPDQPKYLQLLKSLCSGDCQ